MLYVLIASFYALCFIIFVRRNSSSSFSFSIFFEKNNNNRITGISKVKSLFVNNFQKDQNIGYKYSYAT